MKFQQPSWKEKSCHKRSKAGYGGVDYEDVWNLDTRLADIIANHLRAFLKAEKGPYGGCPDILSSDEKGRQKWLQIIRDMLYAFEEYNHLSNSSEFDDLDEEKQLRIKNGMQLFVDYYRYLWI